MRTDVKKTVTPALIDRARVLRRDATTAERAMWRLLREHRADGRWRRQVPLAGYIADFASHRWKVVIEIDGGQHSPEKDAGRTLQIEHEGYRVIRFWNSEVLENPEGCLMRLARLAP